MPIKKKVSIGSSLRGPMKSDRGNLPRKIASSPTPRNDKRVAGKISLSVPVYSLAGRASGKLNLPKEIFGQKVNKNLLSQAIRVYLTNQKSLPAATKTRGEVEGSTAKIYRQKGTGRARHGSIRAPIFVGGGVVFGPKFRKVRLSLPKKMKKAALVSALSSKAAQSHIRAIAGLDKASGKTSQIAQLLKKLNPKLTSTLIVTDKPNDHLARSVRNLPKVDVLATKMINAYEVLSHEILLLSKETTRSLTGFKTTEVKK